MNPQIKVLFIEDNEEDYHAYSRVLISLGFSVTWERYGRQATSAALNLRPAFAIVDVKLELDVPTVDGLLMVHRDWRGDLHHPLYQLPVLILTNFEDPESADDRTKREWETNRIMVCSKDGRDVRSPLDKDP